MISLQKSYFKNCPWMADSHDQPSTSILFEKKCFLQGELFSNGIHTRPLLHCGSFLYLLLFFCAACISSLDEQAFNTVREFWLLLMVDCSCGLCVSRVPVYNTVQPQSGTIVFFSHFYIWSNWIDKVRECDNLTCSVFTPHSALILD